MVENIENQTQDTTANTEENANNEPKSYTKEQLDELLEKARKEGETNGYVKGKIDTNSKWEKKAAERERIAKEEAEKQAKFEKMSELEKAQTQAKEYSEELQSLKDQIALNEQREETRKLMKDKDLPDVFLDSVLVFKDAEKTLAKITAVKDLFDAEVQKRVEAKITTHVPKQNTGDNEGNFSENEARRILKLNTK